ncbi:MAG TPA: response regulator transcription factor [Candidatus Coproplasma excrementipullorum]|nr:response regulator transcription factor [Candidatus Coproplasma excrementipullorum]
MQKILIVEDDNDINSLLRRILTGAGYQVVQAYSGTEALLQYQSASPDLVLLDLMLPGLSGSQVLGKLRGEMSSDVPIIILSAKDGLSDKVALLDIGADDYIVKPFEPDEVVARIRAALRRRSKVSAAREELTYKNIALRPDLRKVTVRGRELALTAIEYELLYTFMRNPEKVYSREKLYEEVWKDGYYGTDHTVNVHVSNLRKKLKDADGQEDYIQSVYGIGFRLAKT